MRPFRKLTVGLIAGVAMATGITACGGDDEPADEPNHAVDQRVVKALANENINRRQAFERLEATPALSYEKFGSPDPDRPDRPLALFVCHRFNVEGASPRSFAELCFLDDKSLGSTLVSVEQGGAPAPATPEGVPTP